MSTPKKLFGIFVLAVLLIAVYLFAPAQQLQGQLPTGWSLTVEDDVTPSSGVLLTYDQSNIAPQSLTIEQNLSDTTEVYFRAGAPLEFGITSIVDEENVTLAENTDYILGLPTNPGDARLLTFFSQNQKKTYTIILTIGNGTNNLQTLQTTIFIDDSSSPKVATVNTYNSLLVDPEDPRAIEYDGISSGGTGMPAVGTPLDGVTNDKATANLSVFADADGDRYIKFVTNNPFTAVQLKPTYIPEGENTEISAVSQEGTVIDTADVYMLDENGNPLTDIEFGTKTIGDLQLQNPSDTSSGGYYTFWLNDIFTSASNGDLAYGFVIKIKEGTRVSRTQVPSVFLRHMILNYARIEGGNLVQTYTNGVDGNPYAVADGQSAADQPTFLASFGGGNVGPVAIDVSNVAVVEGVALPLSSTHVNATDADGDAIATYEVTAPPIEGILEIDSVTATVGATFTQVELDDGKVVYNPPLSTQAEPFVPDEIQFTATDAAGDESPFATVAFIVNSTNTTPTIITNTGLSMNEGTNADITPSELSTQDADDAANLLTYTITDIQPAGVISLERTGTTIDLNTNAFTQEDINTDVGVALIQIVATSAQPPTIPTTDVTISFTVTDSRAATVDGTFTVTVTALNDLPVLAANTLTMPEDGNSRIILGTGGAPQELVTTDEESAVADITYTVTGGSPSLSLEDNSGTTISSFTQSDVDAGNVRIDHIDGALEETTAQIIFTITDTAQPAPANELTTQELNVIFTPTNDKPTVAINTGITAAEGTSGNIIDATVLNINDPDNGPDELLYTLITPPAEGTLVLGVVPLSTNNTFTQQDISVEPLSYTAPTGGTDRTTSFTVSVTDGTDTVSGLVVNIAITNVNDDPTVLINAPTTVNEEQQNVKLDRSKVEVEDGDNTPVDIVFTVVDPLPQNGIITNNGGPALQLTNTFTQADINGGFIKYSHDGTEPDAAAGTDTDSFNVTFTDGQSTPQSLTITFSITPTNDAPELTTPGANIAISEGEAEVLITTTQLNATDDDNSDTELTYTLSNVSSSVVVQLTDPATSLSTTTTTFTQQELIDGLVSITHDGTNETQATFTFSVGDTDTSAPQITNQTFTINITPQNDAPTLPTNNGLTTAEDNSATPAAIAINNTHLVATDEETIDQALLTYAITAVTTPSGTLSLGVGGTFTQLELNTGTALTFTSNGNEPDPTQPDSFTFTVSDDDQTDPGVSAEQTFAINITPVNDAPQLTGIIDAVVMYARETGTFSTNLLSGIYTDEEGDTLNVEVVTNGSFTNLGGGNTFFNADVDAAGDITVSETQAQNLAAPATQQALTIEVNIIDGNGGTVTASVPVIVPRNGNLSCTQTSCADDDININDSLVILQNLSSNTPIERANLTYPADEVVNIFDLILIFFLSNP